jgi:hypothetical protein
MKKPVDVLDEIKTLKASGEPFAVATVVRTVALTAAKAGAKALIRRDGTISAGWIGGGCPRTAVLKAARAALTDGRTRLVSSALSCFGVDRVAAFAGSLRWANDETLLRSPSARNYRGRVAGAGIGFGYCCCGVSAEVAGAGAA